MRKARIDKPTGSENNQCSSCLKFYKDGKPNCSCKVEVDSKANPSRRKRH